ncbi:MAG: hypothetical protein U0350_31535 [Caldilineaceae bacterium]
MQKRRVTLWLSLLTIAVVVLAGCAPRAGGGETAKAATGQDLVVDLPAIVIDFNAQGEPSVGNVPIAQLASTFGAGGLDQAKLPPNVIDQLTKANIQHIQIDNQPSGLTILVNGEAIPSLAWDGKSLKEITATLSKFGPVSPAVEKLLPLITNLGIGVIARFPVAQGKEAIPSYITGEASTAAKASAAQKSFMDNVGKAPKINIPVFYNADGSFRIADLSGAEFTTLTGMPLNLQMSPAAIDNFKQKGISDIALATNANGIHLSINGNDLPYISWDNGKLNHVLDLAGQMGLWNTLADRGLNPADVTAMLDKVLPMLTSTDFSIHLIMPS